MVVYLISNYQNPLMWIIIIRYSHNIHIPLRQIKSEKTEKLALLRKIAIAAVEFAYFPPQQSLWKMTNYTKNRDPKSVTL